MAEIELKRYKVSADYGIQHGQCVTKIVEAKTRRGARLEFRRRVLEEDGEWIHDRLACYNIETHWSELEEGKPTKKERWQIEVAAAGNMKAKLECDGYDTQLLTTRNGYQWAGVRFDDDFMVLIEELIRQYKNKMNI
jgi:hypothetical protein